MKRPLGYGMGIVLAMVCIASESKAAHSTDYNVRAAPFGARGDGITDDATAIQSAINAAQQAGGGVVFFPPGRYFVSRTLTITGSRVQLEGATAGSSAIVSKSSSGTLLKIGLVIASNMPNELGISLDPCSHNRVKNLHFVREVGPSFGSFGIHVEFARFTTLEGVYLQNHGVGIAIGVPGWAATDITTQFVSIVNSWLPGGGFPDAGIRMFSGADIRLRNLFIEPNHIGVAIRPPTNGVFLEGVSVINGGAYDYGVAIDGGTDALKVFAVYMSGINIENAQHQQIYIGHKAERINVANSWLGAGDTKPPQRMGILVQPTASWINIVNNRIGDQGGPGILSLGDKVTISSNQIQGNNNKNLSLDDIQIDGGSDISIMGNMVRGGGRCGIGAYRSKRILITNNNTSRLGLLTTSPGICESGNGLPVIVNSNL